MVSCETRMTFLSSDRRFSHPDICSGGQSACSKRITTSLNSCCQVNNNGFGPPTAFQKGLFCITCPVSFGSAVAVYLSKSSTPSDPIRDLWLDSLYHLPTNPREIDSRSDIDREPARRVRCRSIMPPWYRRYEYTVAGGLAISRDMMLMGVPLCHRCPIRAFLCAFMAP